MAPPIRYLETGPHDATLRLVLAHGAGVGMDAPFMTTIAEGLGRAGIRVVRFEFPYMREQRASGRRRPPDKPAILQECWRRVVADMGDPSTLFIGGKSLGGRVASVVADDVEVRGLVCLGYPFHPPGRPEQLRTEHLARLATRTLILQGSRDPFGTREEIAGYELSPAITVFYLEDGEHSFKPRASSGRNEAQNLAEAVSAIASFMHRS